MKYLKRLTPEDYLDFGKNARIKLSEVYKYEPNYLEWLIFNTKEIKFDLCAFEKLPNPTPLSTGAVSGSQTRSKLYKSGLGLFKADNINMQFSVKEIKEIVEANPGIFKSVNFKFSEEAKKCNEEKYTQKAY